MGTPLNPHSWALGPPLNFHFQAPGPPFLHSLRYLYVAVPEPSLGIPQFMAIGYLDGIPFVRYDSERGRMEPLTQWMKDGVELGYWDMGTQINVRNQHIDARNLETARERYNQSGGLHTSLTVYGCDLLSDGSITRRLWEQDLNGVEKRTNYLKHVCPEWLQRHVRYGQKEAELKEPPDVHVSGREEHGTLILSCHAYGFYPNTIAVSWMKGGETLDQETEWGGIVPNSDGTFHTWARIEVLLEEREQYQCRVEHPRMPEPGIFTWGEAGNVGIGNLEFPNGDSPPHYPAFPGADIWWESHRGDMGMNGSAAGTAWDESGIPEGDWGRVDRLGSGRDSGSEQGSRVGSGGIVK
uniref:Uncharacterized protein n=1 Tax=Geospiza parvula TaxID=87175 RepID=A0A8C3MVU4_GEOPR